VWAAALLAIGACYVIAESMKGQRITQKFVESTMPTGRDFAICIAATVIFWLNQ